MSAVRIEVKNDRKQSSTYGRASTAGRINPQALLFDLYTCPARLPEAEMHFKATKFAVPLADSENVCPCCKQTYEIKEFSFFGNTQRISQVSATVSVYFYFLMFVFLVQFLIFMFNSVSLFALAPTLGACFITSCEPDFAGLLVLFRQSEVLRILTFVTLLLMICLRHAFYQYIKRRYIQSAWSRISADDFSFLLHVPDYKTEEQIHEDLKDIIKRHHLNYTVVNINKVYNLKKYIALIKVISKQDLMMKRMENQGKAETLAYRKCYDTKRFAVESLELLMGHLNTLEGEINHFAKIAFVTFKSNYERMTLQRLLSKPLTLDRTKSHVYWAEEADEPENYLWENFGTKMERKWGMRALTVLATVVCWAVTFILVTAFKYGASQTTNTFLASIPSFIYNFFCYLIITAMHIILGYFTRYLVEKESFSRLPNKLASMAWKGLLVTFVNTAISIAVSSAVNSRAALQDSVWTPNGMVPTMTLIFTFDIIYQHFTALFSFSYIRAYFNRRKLVNAVMTQGENNKVMPVDLHNAHEYPEFSLSGNYTATFYALSMVCFYQQVAPFMPLLGMAMTSIKFVVTRYLLLYRSRRPKNFDFEYTHQMFVMLDFCLLVYGASTAFFQGVFETQKTWYCTLMITMGAVNLLYGLLSLSATNAKSEGIGQELLFEEHSKKLATDYDRSNPLTASKALTSWLAKIDSSKGDPKVMRAVRLSTAIRPDMSKTLASYMGQNKPSMFAGETVTPMKDRSMLEVSGQQPPHSAYSAVRDDTRTPASKKHEKKPENTPNTKGRFEKGASNADETPNLPRDVYYSSVP